MKTIPILFSTEMVQALIEGRKTQTRRVVKFGKEIFASDGVIPSYTHEPFMAHFMPERGKTSLCGLPCPYGQSGDVLWVRETWFRDWEIGEGCRGEGPIGYYYKASDEHPWKNTGWKPSIHMPKAAARLFLKVTDVRVERLQDISEADAVAEGIESSFTVNRNPGLQYKNYYPKNKGGLSFGTPSWSYQSLWQKINGRESWDANPWVWVVTFEKCEKPATF